MAFTSNQRVSVGQPAKPAAWAILNDNWDSVYQKHHRLYALLEINTAPTIASGSNVVINWDAATYDDANFWSSGSPSRLTIPSGVTYCQISFQYGITLETSIDIHVLKNGASWDGRAYAAGQCTFNTVESAFVPCVAGDYFQLAFDNASTTDLDNSMWMQIEAVQS